LPKFSGFVPAFADTTHVLIGVLVGPEVFAVTVQLQLTEMFVFVKRYYMHVAEEAAVYVSLEMKGIKNRRFIALGGAMPWYGNCVSAEEELAIEDHYTVSELRASAEEAAINTIRKIFEVFNWTNPDPNYIRLWQQKLLSRTF
jgi:hypothetical protein